MVEQKYKKGYPLSILIYPRIDLPQKYIGVPLSFGFAPEERFYLLQAAVFEPAGHLEEALLELLTAVEASDQSD